MKHQLQKVAEVFKYLNATFKCMYGGGSVAQWYSIGSVLVRTRVPSPELFFEKGI